MEVSKFQRTIFYKWWIFKHATFDYWRIAQFALGLGNVKPLVRPEEAMVWKAQCPAFILEQWN